MDGGKSVQAVALYGGAGVDLLEDVVQADADAFVMADTKHHQLLLMKQLDIILVDADHFNTEDTVILPLRGNLQEQLPAVHSQKSEVPCGPVQYL